MAETREETLTRVLRMVAPGTPLREGLENILRARTGALIVVGDDPQVLELVDGGFHVDTPLNPSALYELAKMDGAIILSSDAERILYANTQLNPDPMIPTFETGTRHRSAERMARQTGQLVISISQRRNMVTLYKGEVKYVLQDVGVILAKANQALSTLDRYRTVLEQSLINLSALEFEDLATWMDVTTVLQRAQMVARIAREIERYVVELGTEGRLVAMQMEELTAEVQDEGPLVMRDYWVGQDGRHPEDAWRDLCRSDSDELLDPVTILKSMGHVQTPSMETSVTPRGYRILHKIPRLPMPVIENLVKKFQRLPHILTASIDQLDDVEGIGEVRAKAIKEGLHRLREQVLLDRHL
ncbi:MAG: DNA integrity scanning protein DisA [Limnochordaceae bacterium]|uniref:DNA integrity scanning diadenylate cyclase DisA n=1 Tax=Carboxydichorda subterranea TaxID=3109565 RepID=A0ABZ1BYL2_9FIRM|nr:DNA integrity scanning diadenylate cyclase DisA [Limnochorda sp. L945t]MBE3599065.1 DNA integrity scanning protein DisA [Limnochordaceae bacterium]WRP17688.1 DNA integrity scanning diadenylate cyclase DisA [Limnochorda sp. L945t]